MRRESMILLFLISGIFHLYSQTIDQKLNDIFLNRQLMGLSTVAVCKDSVIYSGSFGLADYTRSVPVTDSTLFRVASISKTVTATALMILYEKRLFKLDDDISNVLGYKVRNPNFPDNPITYRMLLSHTSSLQDGTGYSNFLTATYKNTPPPKLISLLSDTGSYNTAGLWQSHAPGTYFNYCNLNFGIVATLVEKLSGFRFDIFCKENIFDPLGMKASYNIQDISNVNNIAVLYRTNSGAWQPQADNFQGVKPSPRNLSSYIAGDNGIIFGPQASLRVSAKDLAKFMIMHMNGGIYKGKRILQDSTVRLMHSPQWTYNGSNGDNYYGLFREWGLGFQIMTNSANGDIVISNYEMKGHTGDSYGLLSDMYFNEENKSGFILITNGSAISYDCASHSAFYAVEEDIYSALYDYSILPCISSADIMETPWGNEQTMYPNAEADIMHTRFYLPDTGSVEYIIYNSLGLQVKMQQINFDSYGRKQVNIDTSGLNSGIYFCVIQAEGNRKTIDFSIFNKN